MTNKEIEIETWLIDFRKILCGAGLSQTEAMAASLKEFGKSGKKGDLDNDPYACAKKWLSARGMIAPPNAANSRG